MNMFLTSLLAGEPSLRATDEVRLFGRLRGRWRTSIRYFPPDGPERRAEGEWEFDYALEGRAVIDIWQVPARAQLTDPERQPGQECGLCVRVYDPRLRPWKFTFHGPVLGVTINMLAFAVGPDIVQERYSAGRCDRWIFSDISDAHFSWRAVSSTDGGQSWCRNQTVEAERLNRVGRAPIAD